MFSLTPKFQQQTNLQLNIKSQKKNRQKNFIRKNPGP